MNFLLEVGTEEIPDWMIPGALEHLRERFSALFPNVRTDATSRRLTVRVAGIPEREPNREEWVAGPAVGAPAQAITGFAKKQAIAPEQLVPREGKLAFLKKSPGRETRAVLAESIPGIVLKIPFPKTMYWTGKTGPRFIRPIRWIVALFGDEAIPFAIAGVHSGNETSGHRQLGKPRLAVTFENYERTLLENGVILSANERRAKIERELPPNVKPDPKLLETLTYLTEYPTVVVGNFDPEFLRLPAEILTTVMRSHQKYFSVIAEDGKLAAQFAAVMNTAADPEGLVQHGNERVLRARFNDARFFWQTDQRKKLEQRVEDLKNVTFQAKLGSYYEKTQRVEGLVAILGGDEYALSAARLCKTDLTTELVKEFTELQGVVGGLYAHAQGEHADIATAIYDHYKPVGMEDSIPRTKSGQLLSIADKLDTLIGCFQVGLIPTGSKDPFALRRAAQGVVKILVEARLRLPLRSFVTKDARLEEFVLERVRTYFRDTFSFNFSYDEVNAVLAAGWADLVDVHERLSAIQAVRPTADFEPLAASFKRIANILKQAAFTGSVHRIEPDLLEAGPEQDLYRAFEQVRQDIASLGYQPALEAIATLRPAVDKFFDKVMVNVPDERVRHNRLALLHALLTKFSTIADFSEIVTNSQEIKV